MPAEPVLATMAAACADLERFGADLRAIPRPSEPYDPADEPEPNVEKRGDDVQDA